MANATITATVAEQTVQENNDAIVRFHLSSALTSSTTVKVSVNPQGGATTADYGPLFYHMGILPGGWLTAPSDGVITINAGFTDFELKTNITNDTITEGYDSLAFTVAQTASSVGIADSWWVPSLVNLLDAVGTGAAALPRTITAGTPTPAAEGSRAEAPFVLNHAGTGYADTQVRVSMYGLGGATAADYTTGTLLYKVGTGGWSPVVGGLITVLGTDNSFSLGMEIKTDSLTESTEGIAFNVAQTTSSIGLVDSWWVQSTVDLQDAQGTGAKALLRTITANTPTVPGIEGSTAPATATFLVSGGNTADYANTQVKVSMYGLGGAAAADYSGVFSYKIMGADRGSVPADGLITINSSDTSFELYRAIATDSLSEASEGIAFNVAQTTSSIGLVDSWWVQSTVDLQDARGTGAVAATRKITANTPTAPGIEGSTPATATFLVSGGNTDDYANTTVKVSMYGLGGATAADYNGVFSYKIGTVDMGSVPADGLIAINSTDTAFTLYMAIKSDTIAETSEGIAFNVAQTTSSIGLVDSWFVQSIVDLADATSIYTTVTGAIGPDLFAATNNPDMFVIPHGTSKAAADGVTGLVSGDPDAFKSGQSFDTITGFAAGTDRIDLPATVTVNTITPEGWAASEEALIAALNSAAPLALGPNEIGTYAIVGHANILYVIVDTDRDGVWTATDDTFIKLVGTVGALSAADFV